jgi:hypothetical protein
MQSRSAKSVAVLVTAVALLTAAPVHAALLDRGPGDPTLLFPQWYRDLNGTAVGLCKSQAQSPNPAAGLAPMCFPLAADPAGFAGNVGGEIFYNNLTVAIGKGAAAGGTSTFALRYIAALEAAYLPGPAPTHGQEVVFARVRIVINSQTPGTYTVTHPFGVEVFPDVGTGPRAVFYTVDIPLGVPGDFDSALNGRLGPFIQWDFVNPGESLTVGNEQFLGDPNYEHTYTGSPFGTNFVQVEGPPGADLDGLGNNVVVSPLGTVLGQRWTAPIATAFKVQKAVYSRGAQLNTVDVWANSAPGQRLVVTGVGLPTIQLKEFPPGSYYGHIEEPSTLIPPASITVTNLSSNPLLPKTVQLVDQLDAIAIYDSLTGALSVSATSSDVSGPTLTVLGPNGGLMSATTPGSYTYQTTIPLTVEPPIEVEVESNAGGLYHAIVSVLAGAPMNPPGQPVANDDAPIVSGAGPTSFDVSANDVFAGAIQVVLLSQPTTGTVTVPASGGVVTFTPNPGASAPDSFSYIIQDAVGLSNAATVSFTVPFVVPPPTVAADNFAMQASTTRAYAVLSNDVAATGTTIDPASIQVVQGPRGIAIPNPDGTVSFTPPTGISGTFTYQYTVANTLGTRSSATTVTVVVFGGPEAASVASATFTVSKGTWKILGSTNWFGPTLTQLAATCWLGTATTPTPATLIGSAPIDFTGKFSVVPAGTFATPPNPSQVRCRTSSGGLAGQTVTFK